MTPRAPVRSLAQQTVASPGPGRTSRVPSRGPACRSGSSTPCTAGWSADPSSSHRRWRPPLAGRAARLRGLRGGLPRPTSRLGYGRDRRLGARRRRHPDDCYRGLPARSVIWVSASVSASTPQRTPARRTPAPRSASLPPLASQAWRGGHLLHCLPLSQSEGQRLCLGESSIEVRVRGSSSIGSPSAPRPRSRVRRKPDQLLAADKPDSRLAFGLRFFLGVRRELSGGDDESALVDLQSTS